MRNVAWILDLRLMEQGCQQTYYLLLDKIDMKVIGRNRDTTDIWKLHNLSALRFYIWSISSHLKDTKISENNSTGVWIQQGMNAQVTSWTCLYIIFCIGIHKNTHVYQMHTYIFQITACYHLNTIAKLHKSHIVIIGSR